MVFFAKDKNKTSFDFLCEHDSFSLVKTWSGKYHLQSFIFQDFPKKDCDQINNPHTVIYAGFESWNHKNKFQLRSDELIKDHSSKKHVLFSGCSQTFGYGIDDIKNTWSHSVYRELEDCSGYYNISRPGISIMEILYDVRLYCEEYGIPDSIFLLLPDYTREITTYGADYDLITKEENEMIKLVQIKNVLLSLWGFEDFCKLNGIRLIYSTWDWLTAQQLVNSGLNNFFSLYGENLSNTKKWINGLQKDGHWDIEHHKEFAKLLLEEINDNPWG